MNDSFGDSWTDGGWIEVYGINGNMAFKGMMAEGRTETHPISLYAPINKNANGSMLQVPRLLETGRILTTAMLLGRRSLSDPLLRLQLELSTSERRSLESLEWLPLTFSSTTSLE